MTEEAFLTTKIRGKTILTGPEMKGETNKAALMIRKDSFSAKAHH